MLFGRCHAPDDRGLCLVTVRGAAVATVGPTTEPTAAIVAGVLASAPGLARDFAAPAVTAFVPNPAPDFAAPATTAASNTGAA